MASQPITITIPWPATELSPNARVHWRKKAAKAKKAKADAIWATCASVQCGLKLGPGQLKVTILAYPPTLRRRDDDNLLAQLKPAFDGVAFALGVDDSQFREPTIEWGEVRQGGDLVFVISPLGSASRSTLPASADGGVPAHDSAGGPDPSGSNERRAASPTLQPGRA